MKTKNLFSKFSALMGIFLILVLPIAIAQDTDLDEDEVTLKDYPDIFTDSEKRIDVVVGENAAATDTLGAIDITTNLQYSSTEEVALDFEVESVVGVQKEFKLTGRKLDLESRERTTDSWGYLINKGSSYIIYTYNAVTKDDFTIVMKIASKVAAEKGF